MKENSIKEDVKIVENYLANSAINETDSNFFKNGGWETVDLGIPKAMKHILSDYKRVLKENEELKEEKEQAWEEWNNLEQGSYETEQKLKQQIKKLQKENETLKNFVSGVVNENIEKDFIPTQKIKDKIEELKTQYKIAIEGNSTKAFILKCQITILQELLEGREGK